MYFSKNNIGLRLKKGVYASSFGFSVNLLTQLSNVPLLLYFWGAELYGEWLILTAIPAYISFSNMGFSDGMSTEMTMLSGKGEYGRAQSVFENTWKVVTLVSSLVAAVVVTALYLVPSVVGVFGVTVIAEGDIAIIVAFLSVYILLGVQFSLIGGAYRCIGRYPAHTFIVNLSKLVELFVGILIVFLGYGPVVLAAVYVIIRICFLAFMIINVRRLNTWISISVKKVDFEPVRGILNPSLSSAGYSLGNIFVNQGVILTIGHFLGGSAVASYSVMRTLTRVLLKFVGILNSNYMPEMSAAFGAKDMELFRDLNRQLSKYTFWMIVVAVVSLGFLGESVLTLWTLDRVELDELVFMFVILEAATYFIGYTGSVPIVAINEHATFVIVYVVFAILGLFMSWMMLPLLGLVAVPVSFVLGNLVVGGFVVASVMKISDDRFFSYIANVIFLKNSYVR